MSLADNLLPHPSAQAINNDNPLITVNFSHEVPGAERGHSLIISAIFVTIGRLTQATSQINQSIKTVLAVRSKEVDPLDQTAPNVLKGAVSILTKWKQHVSSSNGLFGENSNDGSCMCG